MEHKDHFNQVADKYEYCIYKSFSRGFPNEGFYEMVNFIAQLLIIEEKTEILDIGIGTGLMSEKLYDKGAIIYGIDFAEKMLEETKKKMPKAKLFCCDILKGLPIEIESRKFDYIIASFLFHLFTYEVQFDLIRQLENNLKPLGQMIIAGPAFTTALELVKYQTKSRSYWNPDLHFIVYEFYEGTLNNMNLNSSFTIVSPCCGFVVFPAKPYLK